MNVPLVTVWRAVLGFPARLLLGLIWLYQRTISPALPAIFGPACGCRFTPSCSRYAAGALREHGALRGTLLTVIRLAKCTPLHPGGDDPVPPLRPRARPVCRAATKSRVAADLPGRFT